MNAKRHFFFKKRTTNQDIFYIFAEKTAKS